MHRRKGFIIVITLVVSSLILTISLYLLTSIEKNSERISTENKMINYSDLRDREYLLTKAYNKINENGGNLDIVKNFLNSNSEIIMEDCGGVYYDKDKDLIFSVTSFNEESYILSYYDYYKDSLSFSLKYTKFKNKR
ncbi:MAG: hypothetical protein WCQ54_00660 [Clostridiaceae bacterium]